MIKILNNINLAPPGWFTGAARYSKSKEFDSPNGKYKALVTLVQNPNNGRFEGEVTLKSKTGKILFKKSYFATDKKDGFFVVKAAWTKDSRFFVYSLSNSCRYKPRIYPTFFISTDKITRKGDSKYYDYCLSDCCDHPPWYFPTFSFSVDNFEARSLDKIIGAVINPHFTLYAPNNIKILAISKTIKDQYVCKVSLGDIIKW